MHPQPNIYNVIATWKQIFKNIKHWKQLLFQLIRLNLTGQFKRNFLGNAWIIIEPAVTLSIWLILHSAGLFSPGDTEVPYTLYLLAGISIWSFFTSFHTEIGSSISGAGRMLLEAPFPLEIKVLEKIVVSWFNLLFPLVVCLGLILIYNGSFTWEILFFLPSLLPLMLLSVSFGLIFSILEIVLPDIYLIIKRLMTLLMYTTPIVFVQSEAKSFLQTIINYNPLTYLISVPRDLLIGIQTTNIDSYTNASIFSVIIFLISVQLYYRSVHKVIEKILD